jgi:hypothetical protein
MIKEVLEEIDRGDMLSPLRVIEIMSKKYYLQMDISKNYILTRLEQEQRVCANSKGNF